MVKKPIKKNLVKKGRSPKEISKNIRDTLKDCWTVTPPPYEPDIERLHNLVRAELAVIKAEEEKKVEITRREKIIEASKPVFYYYWYSVYTDKCDYEESKDMPSYVKKWYSEERCNRNITWAIIFTAILSLWLWATIMFLILNNQ